MNYKAAKDFFNNISKLGSKLGLNNMTNLLTKLDNPQSSLEIIHVAGTNGKGSVCTMLNGILTSEGYHVGLYTSPYILTYNESIKIGSIPISNKDFTDCASTIKTACDELVLEGKDHPTVFECLTALAFLFFYRKEVDLVVLEVGLGGRYDATNVIDNPLVSVITSISLDHTQFLGDSLDKIAYEKAGIIKSDCPVVLSANKDIVVETIREYSKKQKANLHYLSYKDITYNNIQETKAYTTFDIETPMFAYENIQLGLVGHHQLYNTCTVLQTINILRSQNIAISDNSMYEGLAHSVWECRLELLHKKMDILIDGSHNMESIQSLVDFLSKHFSKTKIVLIFGILGDKEYEEMMALLLPHVDKVILTKPLNDRALPLTQAKETASKYCKDVTTFENYEEALEYGLAVTDSDELLCCAGSLYLVGHIRNQLISQVSIEIN